MPKLQTRFVALTLRIGIAVGGVLFGSATATIDNVLTVGDSMTEEYAFEVPLMKFLFGLVATGTSLGGSKIGCEGGGGKAEILKS